MKALLFILAFVPSWAFAVGVAGFWQGDSFSITATGNKITGYWGKKSYDVVIEQDGYSGRINDVGIKVDLWKHDVTGQLSCGELKITAWVTEVEGSICGNSFVTSTGNQADSDEIAKDTADASFMSEFPPPAHGTIRNHIKWFRGHK